MAKIKIKDLPANMTIGKTELNEVWGGRTRVQGDAHDRYSNVEISYLLYRIESYGPMAILTSNLKSGSPWPRILTRKPG